MMEFVVKDGVVINENGEVGVLYSKAYRQFWNNVRDKKFINKVLFYPPLVLYLARGGDPQNLVDNKRYVLTEEGQNLTKTLYEEIGKPIYWLEDLKYLAVQWIPQGKKIRIINLDGYEKIEMYDEIFWIDIPTIESK